MDFLALSSATARTARTCLPAWSAPPTTHLSPSRLSAALDRTQNQLASLAEATATATLNHTASIADFADSARALDTQLAHSLRGAR